MTRLRLFLLAVPAVLLPGMAQAYIGPGAGVSAIGAALALVAAAFFAVVGLVWYPAKRLMRARRKPAPSPASRPPAEAAGKE